MTIDITAPFCCLDEFCKLYEQVAAKQLLPLSGRRRREGKLCLSEMMFIMALFHVSPFKNFKTFYIYGVQDKYRDCFRDLPSYPRFVELMHRLLLPFALLLHALRGEATGIYFADSTKLAVCHNRRISSHRVFRGLAARGKTTMGWFFGFKLHVIINDRAEIMAVKLSPGNIDDRKPVKAMTAGLKGKLYGDKGFLSKSLFDGLWQDGLQLITGIRKNMRNYLLPLFDKLMLRKRFILETVFDVLKQAQGLEHSRHRLPANAFVHVLSCIVAYGLKPIKPSIKREISLTAYP
jgi:Transposase DDE domain